MMAQLAEIEAHRAAASKGAATADAGNPTTTATTTAPATEPGGEGEAGTGEVPGASNRAAVRCSRF